MKPRVLIVTKFYYRRGGDCVCALNLERLLQERGHEVAVFAMQYPGNNPSEWSRYWPAEVEFGGTVRDKISAVRRVMGWGDIRASFARILREFKPDVVHLHNIHSYLSPVVGQMARHAGARVVWTLHDYKLICPSYSCLRDGHTCEECFTDKKRVLATRCMKGSLAASAIAYAEALRWNRSRLQAFTHRFICPSQFMAGKMEQAGFDREKLITLCNFMEPEAAERFMCISARGISTSRQPYYCYIGRLSPEKGVETLLNAAAGLPFELRVAGGGPLADELREKYGHCRNIRFLGSLDSKGVVDLLSKARASVLPSEWYENNPLGIIESLCAGTPVVGAEIGGIPELINSDTGVTFPSRDVAALREAILKVWHGGYDHDAIARDSIVRFSSTAYYNRLLDIYTS